MTNTKKKTLVFSAVVLILAVLAFLFVFHLPETWRWSGVTRANGAGEEQTAFEISLDLKLWKRLFSHDRLTGTVVIDGSEYVLHKPANDPKHPEVAIFVRKSNLMSPSDWLKDYMKAENFSGSSKHVLLTRIQADPTEEVNSHVDFFEFDF